MHGLQHSAGYIQSKLGVRLKSRFTPVIHFVLDEGVKKSIEVSRLINEALAEPGPAASDPRRQPRLRAGEGLILPPRFREGRPLADGTAVEDPWEG